MGVDGNIHLETELATVAITWTKTGVALHALRTKAHKMLFLPAAKKLHWKEGDEGNAKGRLLVSFLDSEEVMIHVETRLSSDHRLCGATFRTLQVGSIGTLE